MTMIAAEDFYSNRSFITFSLMSLVVHDLCFQLSLE